jgi:hypothetical protein
VDEDTPLPETDPLPEKNTTQVFSCVVISSILRVMETLGSRLPGESSLAHAAFLCYRDIGPSRWRPRSGLGACQRISAVGQKIPELRENLVEILEKLGWLEGQPARTREKMRRIGSEQVRA